MNNSGFPLTFHQYSSRSVLMYWHQHLETEDAWLTRQAFGILTFVLLYIKKTTNKYGRMIVQFLFG